MPFFTLLLKDLFPVIITRYYAIALRIFCIPLTVIKGILDPTAVAAAILMLLELYNIQRFYRLKMQLL